MTSYTRKLYARDPAAAAAFEQAQRFENKLVYGKAVTLAQFTLVPIKPFGKRHGASQQACVDNCGSPACAHGCTLHNRGGSR